MEDLKYPIAKLNFDTVFKTLYYQHIVTFFNGKNRKARKVLWILIFDKVAKAIQYEMIVSSRKCTETIRSLYTNKQKTTTKT